MNIRLLAQVIGAIVLALGIGGLFMGEGQLAQLMNIDLLLDMTRIALGVILIGTTFVNDGAIKSALAVFGIVYLGAFISALVSPTAFGLLPSGLGIADNTIHLLGGLLGIWLAFLTGPVLGRRSG